MLAHEMKHGDKIVIYDTKEGNVVAVIEPQLKRGKKVWRVALDADPRYKFNRYKAQAKYAKQPANDQVCAMAGA